MDKGRSAKILVWILTVSILILFIALLIKNKDRFYSNGRSVGGDGDHLYYAVGTITGIDQQQGKVIVYIDKEDENFHQGYFTFDCSDAIVHWELLQNGQKITFAFLKGAISGTEVEVGSLDISEI